MTGELDRIRERQDGFEVRLATMEETVKTQATLRAAMDEDIADIKIEQRAQRGMLQAVGQTLGDHTRRLTTIEADMTQVKEKLGTVHIGVQAILAVLDRKADEA